MIIIIYYSYIYNNKKKVKKIELSKIAGKDVVGGNELQLLIKKFPLNCLFLFKKQNNIPPNPSSDPIFKIFAPPTNTSLSLLFNPPISFFPLFFNTSMASSDPISSKHYTYNRKQKSLGLLCTKYFSFFSSSPIPSIQFNA